MPLSCSQCVSQIASAGMAHSHCFLMLEWACHAVAALFVIKKHPFMSQTTAKLQKQCRYSLTGSNDHFDAVRLVNRGCSIAGFSSLRWSRYILRNSLDSGRHSRQDSMISIPYYCQSTSTNPFAGPLCSPFPTRFSYQRARNPGARP
ncbi:hypothetical protein CYLTODRAFT_246929 [Cylindrobasidium torrendii FP15055 ss-10]|uniref:Uncharacterized protein n=1 Tax=Cylindrobasidium torrendii FP15055 ss-10 TaxID=1314674 RepID=A0A0D7BFI4_9AGAR|nr:hypothetical protein CYLTODRAFT_246929 [Cylindrobasidium torrendii FP15055 ss-10]